MPTIRETVAFRRWLSHLPDRVARARLVRRIERLEAGHRGDHRFLDAGLFELREHFGPGYRIYFTCQEGDRIILLTGGDKGSQDRDLRRARLMIRNLDSRK